MSLHELQPWMASAIMPPLTHDFRMNRDGHKHRLREEIERVIVPSRKLGSLERLEIYNRQYWFRVLDSLREDFPALARLTGDAGFRQFAESYLQQHPSRSFTLRDLGSHLSLWLESSASRELQDGDAWRAGLGYPLPLLADVAALEWAYIETFDATEFPPLRPDDLENGAVCLQLQPFVQPLALRFDASWLPCTTARMTCRRSRPNRK